MPSENIITQLRLLGEGPYIRGLYAAEKATRGVGTASIYAGDKAEWLGTKFDNLGSRILRYGRTATLAAGIGVGAVAKMGLEFDEQQERAEIGMQTLLRSGQAAKQTVTAVRDFALKAPLFGVAEMTSSAQQLIGAGYDAKKIVPFLTTFSDTISAMGRKPEDLQRMTYAFVQMMSKGQITAEELRGQLGEIFPAQKILAKEMGITSRELAKRLKEGGVKGIEPLMLLFRGMEREFGGATGRMSKTFGGQWANMKEQAKYTSGILFKPLFEELRDHVFPTLNTFGSEWTKVLNNNQLSTQQKLDATANLFDVYLKPKFEEIGRWIAAADIPGKIREIMDYSLPILMQGAADAAPKVLGAFWEAWWNSDLWTKVFTASLLLSKMGAFGKVGSMVVGPFLTGFGEGLGGKKAQNMMKTLGGKLGLGLGRFMGPAAIAAMIYSFVEWGPEASADIVEALGLAKKGTAKRSWGEIINPNFFKDIPANIWDEIPLRQLFGHKPKRKRKRASGGQVSKGLTYTVGEHGVELFSPNVSGQIIPNTLAMQAISGSGGEVVVHTNLILDRKVLARATSRHNSDVLARR